MTFLRQLTKGLRRSYHEDGSHLQGDAILSEMLKDQPANPEVNPGHEEKAQKSLRSVYEIETIDIKTVRPLVSREKPAPPPPKASFVPPQLELDLGDRYCVDKELRAETSFLFTQESSKQLRGRKQEALSEFCRLFELFVIPWVEERGGIASFEEIEDLCERVWIRDKSLFSINAMCQKAFGDDLWDESTNLIPIEKGVYASSPFSKSCYKTVIERAQSYFYREDCRYPLNQIIDWIEKEFVKGWERYPRELIIKCLTVTEIFTLYKHIDHEIYIRYS